MNPVFGREKGTCPDRKRLESLKKAKYEPSTHHHRKGGRVFKIYPVDRFSEGASWRIGLNQMLISIS